MRPRNFSEFFGQESVVGPGRFLRRAIETGKVSSLILYGPPGCGKTTLATLIAAFGHAAVSELNAVTSGVAQIREVIDQARKRSPNSEKTVLLIDEIHRFNKSQQSALLPDLEAGTITLVGTSTENPFFAIVPALASRSQIVELKPLSEEALRLLLARVLADPERGLGTMPVQMADDAIDYLIETANGDARRLLNALEWAVSITLPGPDGIILLTRPILEAAMQKKGVVYDRKETHYDVISAFIKSIRGSDPDAALYWLAKMIYAGEDPLFIARRLIISASEDIGNADPRGLFLATSAYQAVSAIGMPEGRIPLAQATVYLASAPKSNAAYLAIDAALEEVTSGKEMAVPNRLKNAHPKGIKPEERYLYPHDFPDHFVPQIYLPEERVYYRPTDQGEEKRIAARLEQWRAAIKRLRLRGD
jgi:putative ATPase